MIPNTKGVICKCGGTIFEECQRVGGWWKRLVDSTGEVLETNLDRVTFGPVSKTVECIDCGRRVPNPRYQD